MEDKTTYYSNRLENIGQKSQQIKKRLRILGWLRLVAFLTIFPCVFLIIPHYLIIGIALTFVTLFLFLWLVKIYQRMEERYNHLKALATLNSDEIDALDNNYSAFNAGDEFIDSSHAYSYDMDLFGQGSLFQFLNRTVTFGGKIFLANLLSKETLDKKIIQSRQEAVKELTLYNELMQDFRAAGMRRADHDTDINIMKEWINKPLYYSSRPIYRLLCTVLPVITVISIILAFFIPVFRGLAIGLYFLQLFIVGRRLADTSREHNLISQRLEALKKYGYLLEVVEKRTFASTDLKDILQTLTVVETSASASIKKLSKLVSAFDNRLNILAAIFLEGILLWDIQCMIRLEEWKVKQGKFFGKWLEAISAFDALSSLSTFAFNYPHYVFPSFSEHTILETKKIGHILIPAKERVTNDFRILYPGEYIIITGANMAGKSTFLRTVVTNMVLAMSGAPVCAESFSICPMNIFSSMRTSDSLNKHESYFYAELKRLKEMLDRLRNGEQLFVVLDEILKGTNSTDKQKGSRSALAQILRLGGTGIIATHDLELASIENEFPEKVYNYCFEIEIDRANISFDYKLREGITTKMNALLLMQQMGIIQ